MLKKEKDELLKEAEARFNSLTEQEKEELFKKFNKGMFFSPEIQKDIVIGELFYQICAEKGIDPDKFNILNTWKNKPAGGFMSNLLLTVCFTGVIIAAILITKDLLNT